MGSLSKKIDIFKDLLKNKGIDIKSNRHLQMKSNVNNCEFLFGENKFFIYNDFERTKHCIDSSLSSFNYDQYDFETIAKLTEVDIGVVENYFLADIISGSEDIELSEGKYFVFGESIIPFLKDKIELTDFIKKYVEHQLRKGFDKQFIYYINFFEIDGFYVYDATLNDGYF